MPRSMQPFSNRCCIDVYGDSSCLYCPCHSIPEKVARPPDSQPCDYPVCSSDSGYDGVCGTFCVSKRGIIPVSAVPCSDDTDIYQTPPLSIFGNLYSRSSVSGVLQDTGNAQPFPYGYSECPDCAVHIHYRCYHHNTEQAARLPHTAGA